MSSRALTLILAATPSLGIGKNGTLPWPQLKKEMGYFARVTKRVSPREGKGSERTRVNAVVMGRKTWDSIPEKFRPLKGRVNIVVSRSPGAWGKGGKTEGAVEGPFVVGSVQAALEQLHGLYTSSSNPESDPQIDVDRIFIIGGATLYTSALELPQTDRILLTKIKREYECDTFFSVDLDKEGSGWKKAGRRELEEWTGESIGEEGVVEQDVGFEFGMYERVKG
ncbi:hypothetical protein P280DRAFT_519942 [Massarina eburnea CBS 473.64]|uniref:Dihydrofolate reductase n=1 Tax=Massarina eburnea CBS 473.64 TaxID=1395130 RepID=A0A6A6RU19_9PLEO|nr:hypothetical protein P280DRAFT_519942 [Massarina eburnea CBS 473.64]